MRNIDFKTLRTWSMLGQRGTFGVSLLECAEKNDKIIGLTADLCKTSGMDRFAKAYPDRCFNVGIAEQNMVGIAAGLAKNGYIPFATTFANFATLRANEQVRHFMGYMNCNIKLVGFGAGFAMEFFGNTHYGLEDISAIRSFPNITILSPSDCLAVNKCVELATEINGPVYIRLTGKMNNPIVYKEDLKFGVKSNNVLVEGKKVLIYSTGSMTNTALSVADKLIINGITPTIIDVYCLKPFNDSELINYKYDLVVTIEEHSITGGLGDTVLESMNDNGIEKKLLKFGTSGKYKLPGEYNYMLDAYGLGADNIFNEINKLIR